MSKVTRSRRAGVALALTAAMSAGLIGPARRADAAAHDAWQVPALRGAAVSAPLPERPRLEEEPRFTRDPDAGAGGDDGQDPGRVLEQTAVTLRLTGDEARLLRKMLHEAVTNDLDLLEDTIYQTELVDSEAVERIALAIRLDVGMG